MVTKLIKGESMYLSKEQNNQLDNILNLMSGELDISETSFLKAKEHYEAVGKWLSSDEKLNDVDIDIYTQGSFSLGTVIKPLNNEDEYDIDLVCNLNISKDRITPRELKQFIGNRLKESKKYKTMLGDEGSRCWKINYSDTEKFHIDVLPSITLIDRKILESMYTDYDYTKHSIQFTDKTTPFKWYHSNPKGYMKWFQEKMKVTYVQNQKLLMEKFAFDSIDEVPKYKIKTPLQQAIQLLKRHRDIMFKDNLDNKPTSITITTLAALHYNNEINVPDTLYNIIQGISSMDFNIYNDIAITNPVNVNENFADKLNQDAVRKKAFIKWINNVDQLLSAIPNTQGLEKVAELLSESFGEKTVKKAYNDFGDNFKALREDNKLYMENKTGSITTTKKNSTQVKKHTFYAGKNN